MPLDSPLSILGFTASEQPMSMRVLVWETGGYLKGKSAEVAGKLEYSGRLRSSLSRCSETCGISNLNFQVESLLIQGFTKSSGVFQNKAKGILSIRKNCGFLGFSAVVGVLMKILAHTFQILNRILVSICLSSILKESMDLSISNLCLTTSSFSQNLLVSLPQINILLHLHELLVEAALELFIGPEGEI